jgi:hypothetical protein
MDGIPLQISFEILEGICYQRFSLLGQRDSTLPTCVMSSSCPTLVAMMLGLGYNFSGELLVFTL